MSPSVSSTPARYRTRGLLLRGIGGLYTIRAYGPKKHRDCFGETDSPLCGQTVFCRAKGAFRHENLSPVIGDTVEISYSAASFSCNEAGLPVPDPGGADLRIEAIVNRRNCLIRPPVANLDFLFVVFSPVYPEVNLTTLDELISIAEYNHIEPVLVITKQELDPSAAQELRTLYENAGFRVFVLGDHATDGIQALRAFVRESLPGRIAAFAGASGVGKSTLVNMLFPGISQVVGDLARRTERGRQTTRHVELFEFPGLSEPGYLADTPGFSMLDFVRFDFFEKQDLPETFREFVPLLGKCRYTSCTHTKEEDCAIVKAVTDGSIAKSRHDSYLVMYDALKNKKSWDRKN